ncbi:MAG: hypothetical protein HYX96_00965 [Chloroflexi bacterium]|nr:hypothetical protein [Chloroflexota bacterium]
MNGWVGKILKVDLTDRKVTELETSAYQEYIGGLGIGMKILWDENPPDVAPLDPENRLVFMTGPLTGTTAPTSGRMEVCTKALTTPPMCTRSGLGGGWGPELKFAGYDGLIVSGKADKPVYLWINHGKVEFKDAAHLWGMDTFVVQKELIKEYGPDSRTVCIGPAGENLITFSTIQSETGYSASKIGAGAIMGAKNLKAITVRGTGPVQVADIPGFIEVTRQAWELLNRHPIREFTTQGPINRAVTMNRKYRKKFVSCFGCPANCRAWIELPGLEGGEAMCAGGWWYLFIGCRDERAIWEAKLLVDKYGICAHNVLDLVRWYLDLFKAGLITEEETGIPWSKFGTSEFVSIFLRKLAYREGYGEVMAAGPLEAAKLLKPEARHKMGYYFPAYGQGEHYEIRAYPMYLLQWAFDSRDPLADTHDWSTYHSWQHLSWPLAVSGHLTEEDLKVIGKQVYESEEAFDPYSYEKKARVLAIMQNSSRLKNSLVVCDWMFPIYTSTNSSYGYKGDPDIERRIFGAATGINLDPVEFQRAGERIYNLERAILVRDNQRTRKDDTVEDYHFDVPVTRLQPWEPAIQPMTADREKLEKAKVEFYETRGWDTETGRPTRRKLEELNMKYAADELAKLRLLP